MILSCLKRGEISLFLISFYCVFLWLIKQVLFVGMYYLVRVVSLIMFLGGFWFLVVFFFSIGFLSKEPIMLNDIAKYVQFFPQGVVICFYGGVRILLGIYLVSSGYWIVGKGFNEYDKKKKRIRIFRWGFPGKNRCFNFSCSFSDVESLCRENQNSIANPSLYLVLKENRKILLTQLGSIEFRSSREIEYFSANLARFLIVPLKDKTIL
jgi:hypothetical protein